jgi:hypothetical protein
MLRTNKKSCKPASEILAKFHADLKRRGFTLKDARLLLLRPYSAEQALQSFPELPKHKPGFVIPYFDFEGRRARFYRFRIFDHGGNGLGRVSTKNGLRYLQAEGSLNEVYLPPFASWAAIKKDPTRPLIITEGELKAAFATRAGTHPTIGLGGVWCFRAQKKGFLLLPQLGEFEWHDRTVFICFDSDAATNPDIAAAESVLAHELFQRGAIPRIVRLPSLHDSRKTGIDDYLLAKDKDALAEVLDTSVSYGAAEALFELNKEVACVRTPATGIVLRLIDGEVMNYKVFLQYAYANRTYVEQVGDKAKLKYAATEWLRWPFRTTVARITYAPGQPRITDKNEFNQWPGWSCERRKGDVVPFLRLFDHLTTGLLPEEKHWFLQWLAYPLQHPGAKLATAAVLWGWQQGTGKSLLGYSMFGIYGKNALEIAEKHLHGDFNEWAARRQFVMADEMAGGERKRDVGDHLKAMITRPEIIINEKFCPQYAIPDCINYYFTSNHPDAFFLEDSDRRYFVHEVRVPPLAPQFYDQYGRWLDGEGPAALFDHLLQVDTASFNPKGHAPVTAAKQQMIEGGRSELESGVIKLQTNSQAVLASDKALWTAADLLRVYDPEGKSRVTENTLGRKLGRCFTQWGRRGANRAMPVKELGERVWIISRDPEKIDQLNKLNEEQVSTQYRAEHPERKLSTPVEGSSVEVGKKIKSVAKSAKARKEQT